jgi:CRISPR-associated protein Csh2
MKEGAMSSDILKTNSDFLFVYEGKITNPNGDPDMENKPRMDYDTKTNLVTDLRIKRNIREYLKDKGNKIFVDTLADKKVTTDKMLNHIIEDVTATEDKIKQVLSKNHSLKDLWNNLITKIKDGEKTYSELRKIFKSKKDKKDSAGIKDIRDQFPRLNNLLLQEIIKQNLIDIRMFGGAFAIEGFSSTYTGPIQLNWGYSLHPVELMKSSSIVTIMNEDSSTFGKDYRLYYSLIAFHGTINKHLAAKTGLKENDRQLFREAMINSISYKPTRSKSGQYAVFYLELEYIKDFNGYLRDLRDFINCKPKSQNANIRSMNDLEISLDQLKNIIYANNANIKRIHIWKTPVSENIFNEFKNNLKEDVKSKVKDVFQEK